MQKKLILISGSPCVGKTAAGTRLFENYDNSAYLDGDWCWCVHPFSVADPRLRNGDRSMSFVLSNYLDSDFEYVFFTSVVLTDAGIREGILNGITAREYRTLLADTQAAFDRVLAHRYGGMIAWDRVHPNLIGATVLARVLLDALVFDYAHRTTGQE